MKWLPSEFRIAMGNLYDPHQHDGYSSRVGFVDESGLWGMDYRTEERGWVLTSIPCGMRMPGVFASPVAADAAAAAANELLDWTAVPTDFRVAGKLLQEAGVPAAVRAIEGFTETED